MKLGTCWRASCAFGLVAMWWRHIQVQACSCREERRIPIGMPAQSLLRYLLFMTANIYRLIQEIHAMPDRSPAPLRAMFKKYDSELLDA